MIYHTCIIWYIRAENIQISECLQVLSTTIPNIACLLICDALRTELHRSVLPSKRLVFKNSLTRKKIKCISVMIWVSIWGLSCLSFFAYTGQIVWIEWFDLYWAYACLEQSKGLNTLALVPAHRGIRMVSKKIAFEARPSMPWKPGQVGSKLHDSQSSQGLLTPVSSQKNTTVPLGNGTALAIVLPESSP